MGAFGERMRKEREMRGITLEAIAEATKISTRSLKALEDEDFGKLPGGIFNKGFVRSYARFIGIDEGQAVADFVAVAGDPEQPLPDPPPRPPEYPDHHSDHLNWAAVFASSAVLALGVVSLWLLAPKVRGLSHEVWRNARTHFVRQHRASRKQETLPLTTPTTQPPSSAEITTTPPSSLFPPKAAKSRLRNNRTSAAMVAGARPGGREFVVAVKAKEDSWVSITADGKLFTEGLMNAPTEKLVRAKDRVVLTTGNAGGVQVSHNGRRLILGAENQVTTVTFTPTGIRR